MSSSASCFTFLWSALRGNQYAYVNQQRYSVVGRIGEGGFSYVDLVTRNGRRYALKRILIQLPEQREAVENEIRVHRAVSPDDECVIQLVDAEIREASTASRERTKAFLLFPYYGNGTLQDMIDHSQKSKQPLREEKILALFLSLCHGLLALHFCSLVHRDVKPANVLLNDTMDGLVLMDMGSAASSECRITNRQEALALQELCAQTCTAHYRAPELFEVSSDCTITAKTDVWSLGCSLYAAAFGQSPCDGSALSAMSSRTRFPSNHVYSQEFCCLVRDILQVDPSTRPSVEAVRTRISNLMQSHKQAATSAAS